MRDPRFESVPTFLLTKIEAPVPQPKQILRERCLVRLRDALQVSPLVLLCAPAGFGKTVTLAQALTQVALDAGTATVWVQAESIDDLGGFATCLVAALEPHDPPWRQSPEGLIAALDGTPQATRSLLTALANALHGCDVSRGVIAIDDADRLQGMGLSGFIEQLVEAMPTHWCLALSCRVDPELPLARWRIQSVLLEFRQDDLRFDADEVRALLQAAGSKASQTEVDEVLAHTQGWPAALSLLTRGARGAISVGTAAMALDSAQRRHLYAYLASEVLQVLPASLAGFLELVSVLPEWRAARCAALTGDADAALHLAQVEQRGLFVSRRADVEPVWVPDSLFREFLLDRLSHRGHGQLAALRERAAATEPDPARRVDFLLQAGLDEAAAQALLQAAPELLGGGRGLLVSQLLERFAPEMRAGLPDWSYVQGQLAWQRWDWPALDLAMQTAGAGFKANGRTALALSAAVLRTLALAGRGALDAARKELHDLASEPLSPTDQAMMATASTWVAAALGPPASAAAAIEDTVDALLKARAPAALWALCLPNFRFTSMPGLQSAIDRFVREAMGVSGDSDVVALRQGARTLMAWRLLWRGDVAASQLMLDELEADADWFGMPRALHWSVCWARAGLHALAGRSEVMHKLCRTMLDEHPPGNPWRRATLAFWLRLTWLVGDAETWHRIYPSLVLTASPGEWPHVRAGIRLAEGQNALMCGDPVAAEALLMAAAAELAPVDTVGSLDTAEALLALSRLRQNRHADAMAALRPCLQRIADGGERLGLQLLGLATLDELVSVRPSKVDSSLLVVLQRARDEARRLHSVTLSHVATDMASVATADPLSPREREVLGHIAAGASNKVIARELDLSPHTVKRHVGNLLNKLGLSTRAQAAVWLHTHVAENQAPPARGGAKSTRFLRSNNA